MRPLSELSKPIPIDRVQFRVQSISKSGWALLLAYKDARVDQDRLDEVVGRGYWQRYHTRIDGKEYCTVQIYNPELKQWIGVQDCGVPSNNDGEKGESSDAFKRACFNLGIGRELYSYPLLLVQLKPEEYKQEKNNGKERVIPTHNLRLKEWTWIGKHEIVDGVTELRELAALDQNGAERYRWPRRQGGTHAPASEGTANTQTPAASNTETPHTSSKQHQGTNTKPWFNLTSDILDEMASAVTDRITTPEKIIADIEQHHRLNKADLAKILAL